MPPRRQNNSSDTASELDTLLLEDAAAHGLHVDQMYEMEPLSDGQQHALRRESFLQEFASSKGPPQIVILCLLLALGFGSTIGVVPATMTDRYARLNHGYDDNEHDCSSYIDNNKPQACLDGSADAQSAVAMEQLISNLLTFFTSSLIGSLSDEYGRKVIMVLGLLISSISPLCLVLIQIWPEMSPFWYYGAGTLTGLVSWTAVALSALSDVMPPKWRAPSFGLLLAGFSLGFAISPTLALFLGHFQVSVLSLVTVWLGLIITIFFFPETLPEETALEAREVREAQMHGRTHLQKTLWVIYRPIWELSILNRSRLFRLLSALAFFSGMVSAGDRTLLIYYLEERLAFNDRDIAALFSLMGILGIFVQGFLLKFVNDCLGERRVVMFAFALGAVHNFCYGLAKEKALVFVGIAVSAFVGMAFPTISAIKSNNVEESEQGRIQGALYSLSALASAVGPMAMRFVYHYTKDGALLGPGSMFIAAAGFYFVAVYLAYELPAEADSKKNDDGGARTEQESETETNIEAESLLI